MFHLPLITRSLYLRQEFTTSGSSNTDTGKSGGHLETKYKIKDLGLSFNQKWSTDNTLTTEITLEDQVKSSRRDMRHFKHFKHVLILLGSVFSFFDSISSK